MPGLFAALDHDWDILSTSRGARGRSRAWQHDPELRRFATLTELLAAVRGGATSPDATDRVLAALARRASHDELAARTLLQALLPGIVNVAKRLGRGRIDDELEAEVLAEAVVRVRTYPIERRPRFIAANVTWDVFGAISRRRRRNERTVAPMELPPTQDPAAEVCELVRDALETGKLRTRDARLLLSIAVGHDTIATCARREGVTYDAMNERWRRARNRLRAAVA